MIAYLYFMILNILSILYFMKNFILGFKSKALTSCDGACLQSQPLRNEVGRLGIQGHLLSHSELKASLGFT